MMPFYILLSVIIGFAIVSYTIPKIIFICREKKLFDVPNERSASRVITPSLGGVAIFAGFFISLIITLTYLDIQPITCLLLGTLVMFLTGLKDDLIGLSPRKKLIFQILTALYLIFLGGVSITNLHGILGFYEINTVFGSLLSLLLIVGIINAYNLIDGIDGLAAGVGILISIVFGALFTLAGHGEYAIVAFSLTGSLIAFFFFNVFGKENKIFMGDTGSLTLGIIFAFLTIKFINLPVLGQQQLFGSPAVALAIMIIPIVDTIRVMTIRMAQKKSPFSPDMNHIHHHLLRLTNYNHLHASLIIIVSNLAFITFACGFVYLLGNNLLFLLLVVSGFSVAYIPVWINKQNEAANLDKEESNVRVLPIVRENNIQKSQSADR